jgi:hypothetical protein
MMDLKEERRLGVDLRIPDLNWRLSRITGNYKSFSEDFVTKMLP